MSRTARCGAVVTIIAVGLLSSCARPSMDPNVGPHVLADAESPININFTCNGTNQISLTDNNGVAAWTFKARKNNPVSWQVPANVTINAISSKSPAIPLPVSPNGSAGGSNGKSYDAKVNADAVSKRYFYNIDVTCTPTSGAAVRLVIDPDMIVV